MHETISSRDPSRVRTLSGRRPGARRDRIDGQHVWFASGDKLNAFDPASGKTVRSIDVAAHAGTAFDGQHLFQIAEDRIQKIDPKTGRRACAPSRRPAAAATRGSPGPKARSGSGQYRRPEDPSDRSAKPGAILRTIESNRFVTGVTWVDGELWHGTWEGTRATCAGRSANRERFWRHRDAGRQTCRGSSPTAAIASSAAAEAAAR